MAQPLNLGEALVALVLEGIVRFKPSAEDILARLRVAARPPEGVSFQSDDGASYTGLVLVDHNHVTAMLASRAEPPVFRRPDHHERASLAPRPSQTSYMTSQRSLYDPDEPDDQDWEEPPGYGRYK